MHSLLLTVLSCVVAAPPGGPREPRPSNETEKTLMTLTRAALEAGALGIGREPKSGDLVFRVADREKLRRVLLARKQLLTPDYRSAIVAICFTSGRASRRDDSLKQVMAIQLEIMAEELKDPLTRAWSAACNARVAEVQGKFDAALKGYQQASRQFAEAKEPLPQIYCRLWVGGVHQKQGKLELAQKSRQEALTLLDRLRRQPDLTDPARLQQIAQLSAQLRDFKNALEFYQRALTALKKQHSRPHPSVAAVLERMAALHAARNDRERALACRLEALAIREKLPEDEGLASSLEAVGHWHFDQDDHDRALPYFQRALAIRRKLYGTFHDAVADLLHVVGVCHLHRGEYKEALAAQQEALRQRQILHGKFNPLAATCLSEIGNTYRRQGEFSKARDYYLQDLAMQRQFHGNRPHRDVAISLTNVGIACHEQGDYAQAFRYHQQALEMFRQVFPTPTVETAQALTEMGLTCQPLGKPDRARKCLEEALALKRKLYPGAHPLVLVSVNNLLVLCLEQGDDKRAQELATEVRDLLARLPNPRHPVVLHTRMRLVQAYHSTRQYAAALKAVDETLALLRLATDAPFDLDKLRAADLQPLPLTVQLLHARGAILDSALPDRPTPAQLAACERSYSLALAVVQRVRREVLQRDDSKLRLGKWNYALIGRHIDVCRRLYEQGGDPRYLEAAFTTAELGRARVFAESLGRSRAGLIGGVAPALRQREDELSRRLQTCERQIEKAQARPGPDSPQQLLRLWDEREQIEAALRRLSADIEAANPQYAALKYPKPCTLTEARACLNEGEVALLFAFDAQGSSVVLVEKKPASEDRGRGLAIFRLPDRQLLRQKVRTLVDREVLRSDSRTRRLGAELHRRLLGPLADRIKGKDLVILPDEVLWELPFELLVEGAGPDSAGRYLIETRRIRYAPSMTALHLIAQWERKRQQPTEPVWALGDPIFQPGDARLERPERVGQASRAVLERYLARLRGESSLAGPPARLPATRAEVQAVGKLLGGPDDVVVDLLASEATVKSLSERGLLARKRHLHLATHGILATSQGRPPSLILNLVGNDGREQLGGPNDGFLTREEVMHLQLNADLVVLSACETGKGVLHLGEGIVGLSRAFLYAGSRGVVCSLWQVDDERTAALMEALYTELKGGKVSSAEALALARRKLIAQEQAPFYWAPFILIGK
jgi:CHAT domain-containing protein